MISFTKNYMTKILATIGPASTGKNPKFFLEEQTCLD